MADVKWIKLIVGMFDGNSFKRIKKAKIGGESFRDKLTAVWFELMDFAGKCNEGGRLIESPEIPFSSIEDIAIIIDREPEELNLCMQYFINNRMITVIDDVYMLTNWAKHQNEDGLEKIRAQTRKRVAKHREQQKLLSGNDICNVTVTQCNATDKEGDKEKDKEGDKEGEGKESKSETPPHPQQIIDLFNSICTSFNPVQFASANRKQSIEQLMNTYTVDNIKQCFEMAEKSAFLKGKNKRNWVSTFDWLINEENMAKVLEGNFSDNQKAMGAFDTDEFFNAALNRSAKWVSPRAALERDAAARMEEKSKSTRLASDDPEYIKRVEKLKQELQGQ